MGRAVLLLELRDADDGAREVLSPGVGWWRDHPHAGALVGPGTAVGVLEVQNRAYRLILPDGAGGRITGTLPSDRRVAVEFGEVLLRLVPVAAGDESVEADAGRLGHPGGADLPEGTRAIVAPTDGVFYSRPSPDAPPFVGIGDAVVSGQPVGLVEVMKTFNTIQYGGPGFPERATVVDVRASDGAEVRAGQVLIVVR